MTVWYNQDFESFTLNPLAGQGGWEEVPIGRPGGTINVSNAHVISGTKSCELIPQFRCFKMVKKNLDSHEDYSFEFKVQIWSGANNAWLHVWMNKGPETDINWRISVGGNGSTYVTYYDYDEEAKFRYKTRDLGYIDYSAAKTFAVSVDLNKELVVKINSVTVFTGGAAYVDADQIVFLTAAFSNVSTFFVLDDILAQYVAPPLPSIPESPKNLQVNVRDNYSVVSWDKVEEAIINEDVTKGSGSTDALGSTNLSSSPTILKAIIGGITVSKSADLPVEGIDFKVNKITGVITWISSKDPDNGTQYRVTYKIAINDLQMYRIYKSSKLNEFDRRILTEISSLDVKGNIDTAYVDTETADVAAYRVAAINTNMVESELSDKVIATKLSSQIDDKKELPDRMLFVLDTGLLNNGIIR
jgi:hypothetical protein